MDTVPRHAKFQLLANYDEIKSAVETCSMEPFLGSHSAGRISFVSHESNPVSIAVRSAFTQHTFGADVQAAEILRVYRY